MESGTEAPMRIAGDDSSGRAGAPTAVPRASQRLSGPAIAGYAPRAP
jgi:hypothetical protein